MKKKLVIIATFVVGLYYFLEFVLPPFVGGGFDCRSMDGPCLVETDAGYRLYYTGIRSLEGSSDQRLAIGLAQSADAVTWTKYNGNPLLARSLVSSKDWRSIGHPAVVREADGSYTMFYVGKGADNIDRVMRTASRDGLAWRGRTVVLSLVREATDISRQLERASISALAVLRNEDGYVAYFAGTYRRGEETIQGVSRATSPDGITWTLDEAHNPVLPIEAENGWEYKTITSLSVVRDGGALRLYYAGTKTYFLKGGQMIVPMTLVGLATSPDGITWTRHGGNPIFGPALFERGLDAYTDYLLGQGAEAEGAAAEAVPDRFDAAVISGISVIRRGDGYLLAYAGAREPASTAYQIGLATSEDGITWQAGPDKPALALGREPTSTYLFSITIYVSQVFIVVGAMALGLGLFGLAKLHGTRIIRRHKDTAYSLAFFFALIFTLVVALGWGQENPAKVTPGNKLYDVIFKGLLVSFGASSMGLLTFYLASASYRSFKLKNAEAALMMLAAILVMLGQVPLGQLVTAWLPRGLEPLQIQNVTLWMSYTIVIPAMRAIQIGAAVGGLVLATRLWLSMERRRD
jgi:hypothetical protein